jgi:acetyl-CoA C-acetyltransferase
MSVHGQPGSSPNGSAVIVGACRTPIGSFRGALATLRAPELGSVAIRAALSRAGVAPDQVDEVIMGQVLTAGVGQAPARQAALGAGLPNTVPATTVSKVCGSGLKALMFAAQAVAVGDADLIVAGGMESMSNAPYLLEKARAGYGFGHQTVVDSMIRDGLWDFHNDYHMGNAAELLAKEYAIGREAQDEFAIESYRRAQDAQQRGAFAREIVPVPLPKGGEMSVDEEPARANFAKMPTLRPVFDGAGTITAANASALNDGAAALVVMSERRAEQLGATPLATIEAQASAAIAPELFVITPGAVVPKVLERAGMQIGDMDLVEINEAFAVGNLALERDLQLDRARTNVNGGAVALGHPIGASGARIMVTLLHALEERDAELGMAAICIGGGEACGVVVRRGGSS